MKTPEKKSIKVVTLTIRADRLFSERDRSIIFTQKRRGRGVRFITFAKSQMYNFSKVIVYFPHWKGRTKEKAFKFDIPLWLFYKMIEEKISLLGDDVIINNTHVK